MKLHVVLDQEGMLPAFAAVTAGTAPEMEIARAWLLPRGSLVVFDNG
ncbi:MAG: hypothetical protein H7X91_04150 [Burkholderiales bacterium]|nr:hypothetical protein [Burkholderiales bacterium]